eukprot:CAMPEP_0173150652 /NCGR_PEP_ID=MMETSP1105-20130129/11094_1 /TAXON_ID=2985 /ORGANISM="Ochromonas sp., Strain BG-1" /LENGTH=197 /DNA_ID=CAMNT_0014065841 /DNA_START=57 /DNA_END=650 /DNA_ORIENTATION=-
MKGVQKEMRGKIDMYRKEGRLAIKHMWIVICIFAVVQVIVSCAVAASNSETEGGYKSASFAAIWSMLLVIVFTALGGKIVLGGRSSELLVGFLIGVAAMLSQLCFVLMVIFFIFGTNAKSSNLDTAPSDQAYAAFSLINMIIYFVWTILLVVHRKTITVSKDEHQDQTKEFAPYDGHDYSHNPTIGAGDDFGGEEQL